MTDHTLHRRNLLKSIARSGTAIAVTSDVAGAQQQSAQPSNPPPPKAAPPTAAMNDAEKGHVPEAESLTTRMTGSDFMVDVVKRLNIDYIAAVPGSTFRALQESFINYGANTKPEWLTCLHEEQSVAMCHGYAKVAGKPMAAVVHGTVGLHHATMAIYNAWCDRVPMLVITGNAGASDDRRPGVEWMHSMQDNGAIVRDFTKWDDYPASLQHFAESMTRAHALSMSVPTAPVLINADGKLQEMPLSEEEHRKLSIPALSMPVPPAADSGALREAVRLLLAADNPVIVADRYARTDKGMGQLVAFAELIQAPVVDLGSRMNFPNQHALNHTERSAQLLAQADVILALEPVDLYGMLNKIRDQIERTTTPRNAKGPKVVSISSHDLLIHANYQDFQRYQPVTLAISADAEASMPGLIEALKSQMTDQQRDQFGVRGRKLADLRRALFDRSRQEAAQGWDASPISTARVCMELWNQIKNEDWAMVHEAGFQSHWPRRLWTMDKPYHHIGGSGGAGVGYQASAAVGAALAHRDAGRNVIVSITGDGDLNMGPGVLWTAAHHRIPLLTIVHNNRAYHQEVMHLQRMANRHNRGIDRAPIGTVMTDPNIDYAKIAAGYGVASFGPITSPEDLAPAITKALQVVKSGQPALIDAVMQPR